MRKEKLRKVGLCFITGCFIKPFKMIINFFISEAHSQRNFPFLIPGISKRLPVGIYIHKVNNGNSTTRCEIC